MELKNVQNVATIIFYNPLSETKVIQHEENLYFDHKKNNFFMFFPNYTNVLIERYYLLSYIEVFQLAEITKRTTEYDYFVVYNN